VQQATKVELLINLKTANTLGITVTLPLSGTRLLACLILAPQRGYDEPGILSYAISSFCPTSVDGLQIRTRRAPSPQIGARDTALDGAANGSAGVHSAPDMDAGANSTSHLGGQRRGDHEDGGEGTNERKLAEHC
jgi:hypothetical protein